ncbi:hypothetical protein [Enterococcus cecorum]|uniref:hypothetical protein n=1 Tax=Enterococcus cecorum TaxID=44008 RepID=UPI0032C3D907
MVYKIALKDALLYIYIYIYSFYFALHDSVLNIQNSKIIIMISTIPAVLIIFKYGKFKIKNILFFIVFGLIVLYSFYQFSYSDSKFILLFLTGLVISCYDDDTVFKTLLSSKFFVIVLILILGGFNHRNAIGSNFGTLIFLICIVFERNFQKKIFFATFLFFSILTLYLINPENSGVIVVLSVFMVLYLLKDFHMTEKLLTSRLTNYIYPISFLINLFLSYSVYSSTVPIIGRFLPSVFNEKVLVLVNKVNIILGTRLSLAKTALIEIPIVLFGGRDFLSKYTLLLNDAVLNRKYFLVDSGYILLLLKFGVIPLMAFMYFSTKSIKYFKKNNFQILIILSICFALWGILEDNLFYGFTVFFWAKGFELSTDKITSHKRLVK